MCIHIYTYMYTHMYGIQIDDNESCNDVEMNMDTLNVQTNNTYKRRNGYTRFTKQHMGKKEHEQYTYTGQVLLCHAMGAWGNICFTKEALFFTKPLFACYLYVYIYIYMYIYIYTYIEREREIHTCVCVYIYIYICVHTYDYMLSVFA